MARRSASLRSLCLEPELVLVLTRLSDSKDSTPQVSKAAPGEAGQTPSGGTEAGPSLAASDRPAFDLVMPLANATDGAPVPVLRARPGRVELGEVRPLVHGRPVAGELVQLKQRKDSPQLYDVESSLTLPEAGRETDSRGAGAALPRKAESQVAGRRPRTGPAQVATEAYRSNWERIYRGGSNGSGGLLN